MKTMTKTINVRLKYGISEESPFNTTNTFTHPSTIMNVVEPGSKLFDCYFVDLKKSLVKQHTLKPEIRSLSRGRQQQRVQETAGRRPSAKTGLFMYYANNSMPKEVQNRITFCKKY